MKTNKVLETNIQGAICWWGGGGGGGIVCFLLLFKDNLRYLYMYSEFPYIAVNLFMMCI